MSVIAGAIGEFNPADGDWSSYIQSVYNSSSLLMMCWMPIDSVLCC